MICKHYTLPLHYVYTFSEVGNRVSRTTFRYLFVIFNYLYDERGRIKYAKSYEARFQDNCSNFVL